MKDKSEELDELLDRVLSAYAETEPLTGLESRVLERVRMPRSRRLLSPWLVWALGALATCGVLLFNFKHQPDLHYQAVQHTYSASSSLETTRQPQVWQAKKAIVKTAAAARYRRAAKRLPKLLVFPTPSPLTPEERALVAFAQNHPAEAVRNFADLRQRTSEPVQIQPIQIRPLDIGGAQ